MSDDKLCPALRIDTSIHMSQNKKAPISILKQISTADLVNELASREGVIIPHKELWFKVIDSEIARCGLYGKAFPKIIVVVD